jgi:23S rRNA (cytidine1920-2'-O)/16S rRNA (cytidine1409-2'-O)-methyltransferase
MPIYKKMRLDRILVDRGLGRDSLARRRSHPLMASLREACSRQMRGLSKSAGVSPFVSRGGIKLAAAFDAFGLDPKASSRSIIGASTGGFTEVLLECGAAQAVDVGSDQLHAKLRGNPRVVALGKD